MQPTDYAWKSSKTLSFPPTNNFKYIFVCSEKGKSLNKCNALVPWDPFLSMCIQKVCECLRNKREQECKCNAALNYASQCNAQKQQTVDISGWRVDLGCGEISITYYFTHLI
jgi:C8 domain